MIAPPPPSPYRGLAPFEDSETDARLFFGRERERTLILANLMASRLTVLYGASGVGKSSLLSAGVAHELGKTDSVAVLRSWADDPLVALDAIVDRVEDGGDLYVILDQIEEFFVYHGVNGPASRLAAALAGLLDRRNVRVSVLLGVREESLAKLDAFKPRLPNVLANYFRLEHLDRGAARGAITEPLRRFEELGGEHWEIEPALVEAVLDEVSAGKIDGGAAPPGRIETPYLQLVMQRLWEAEREEGSSVLRLATLRKLGGAERIVREHLDRALATLTPVEQDAAARMFDHLVTPSGAKIAHHLGDLVSYAGVEAAAARGVIARLEGERIVRPIEEGRVEIYHDVLGDSIATWRRDHEANREVRRARRRARRLAAVAAGSLVALVVVSAIAVYALSQRREAREQAALARVAAHRQLAAREDAEKQRGIAQSNSRDALLAKAQAVQNARLAQTRQQQADKNASQARASQAAAEDAFAVAEREKQNAKASADGAQEQRRIADDKAREAKDQKANADAKAEEAKHQKKKANASARAAKREAAKAKSQARINQAREFVLRSAAALNVDAEQSIRWAYDASRLEGSPAAEDALRDALASFRLRAVFRGGGGPLRTAVFSPDSRFVVTAAAGGEVRLFNVESRQRVRTFEPSAEVTAVSFSPDARTFIAGTLDGRALLWNVDSGALLKTLPHHAAVNAVDFSSDGRLVVTGGADGVVRVWEPASGLLLRSIDVGGAVRSFSLQRGGRLAVVVTRNGSARVVDLATGDSVANLDRPGGITVASFSPRGDVVVAGGAGDGYIWDARSWQLKSTLEGHKSTITDVAFRPDGQYVMTTSADTTARLWSVSTGQLAGTFNGWHLQRVVSGAVSSKKDTWATASDDGAVALWVSAFLPNPVVLSGHGPAVTRVAFSSDGSHVLTTSRDGNARLWRVGDPDLRVVEDQGGRTPKTAFDPSGERLLTAAANGTGRLYTTQGTLLKTLALGPNVTGIAFSGSGRFVTANEDGNGRLWKPNGSPASTLVHGSPIRTLAITYDGGRVATGADDGRVLVFDRSGNVERAFVQGAPVTSVAFASPETLVGGGADGSVVVFDLRAGVGKRSLSSHRGAVRDISVGPGGLLATASDDGSVQVYELRTGKLRHTLLGHASAVNLVLFSPDGQTLLSASTDGDVRTWSMKTWRPVILRGRRPPEVGAHHTGVINSARFSPDGRWIVTGGPTAAGIWQRGTGDLLYFVRGHGSAILAVTFAADNRRMFTAGIDGTMRTYRCDLCGRLPALQKLARSDLALAARGR